MYRRFVEIVMFKIKGCFVVNRVFYNISGPRRDYENIPHAFLNNIYYILCYMGHWFAIFDCKDLTQSAMVESIFSLQMSSVQTRRLLATLGLIFEHYICIKASITAGKYTILLCHCERQNQSNYFNFFLEKYKNVLRK